MTALGLGVGLPFTRARGGAPSFQGVLDAIEPQPLHGWSFARRLRGVYDGPLRRIRRSNDNAQTDIGFVDPEGYADEEAIADFVGANSAFDRTLYDQVGNLNFAQAGNADQPRAVDDGVMERIGGRLASKGDGSTDRMLTDVLASTIMDGDFTLFLVFKSQSGESIDGVFEERRDGAAADRVTVFSDTRDTTFRHSNYSADTNTFLSFNAQQPQETTRQLTLKREGNTITAYAEGEQIDQQTSSGAFSSATLLVLFQETQNLFRFGGSLAEALLYGVALSDGDREVIEVDQAATYMFALDALSQSQVVGLSTYRLTEQSWGEDDGVTDPIARIIRVADDAEQTFTYADNNILDFDAIDAWLEEENSAGQWLRWYNQAGGNDAVATADNFRPLYVPGLGPDFDAGNEQRFLRIEHEAGHDLTDGFALYAQHVPRSAGGNSNGHIISRRKSTGQVMYRMASADTETVTGNGAAPGTPLAASNGSVPHNEWSNVLFTAEGTDGAIYVDGEQKASGTVGDTAGIEDEDPTIIGRNIHTVTTNFNGLMNTVIIGPVPTERDRNLLGALPKPPAETTSLWLGIMT